MSLQNGTFLLAEPLECVMRGLRVCLSPRVGTQAPSTRMSAACRAGDAGG